MLGVSEGKTTNKNLIDNSATKNKEVANIGSFKSPSQTSIVDDKTNSDISLKKEDKIEENIDSKSKETPLVNNVQTIKEPFVKKQEIALIEQVKKEKDKPKFNKQDALMGFEEVKNSIKNLYDEIFGYGDKFKPTFKDTIGDFLSYLGGLSVRLSSSNEFVETFGINPLTLNEKYYSLNYVPYAIKIGVWAYKNKAKNNIYDILNGTIQTAFSFLFSFNEESKDDKAYNELYAIIDFIKIQGVNIDNKWFNFFSKI